MRTTLPGQAGVGQVGVGLAKAALRLVGGTDLADAISDLTGLGRVSVQDLARRASVDLQEVSEHEFRSLTQGDREWVECAIVRAYQNLAREPHKRIAKEALIGSGALTSLAFSAGLSDEDRLTLGQISLDASAYFRSLSNGVARLISAWYTTDVKATQAAVALGVGELLLGVRETLARLEAMPSQLKATRRIGIDGADRATRLMLESGRELSPGPSYYPHDFQTQDLADALRVYELDSQEFHRFSGRGLYWGGRFYTARLKLTEEIAPGRVVVVLGDPGSGKSTLGKGLVLSELASGRPAIFCRLEDLSAGDGFGPAGDPLYPALRGCARAAQHPLTADEASSVSAYWRSMSVTPLVVLDGLDEVATAAQFDEARRCAMALANAGHAVVVTSRVAGYTTPWAEASRHFAMAPLEESAQRAFAQAWFIATHDESARARFERATQDTGLGGVLESPLTLGFVCLLSHYEEAPPNRAGVFDRFIDYFLRSPWRPPSKQRIDLEEVASLRQSGESVAWAMANFNRSGRTEWVDSVQLDEIRRATGNLDAYVVYASGLLIPHGPVESLGGTQQGVRWIHRTIHENMVAQRLRAMVQRGEPEWRTTLGRAALLPSWDEALRQCFMLMGDGSELHAVIDELEHRTAMGDLPNGALAHQLALAGRYCRCPARKKRVASYLTSVGAWVEALSIDRSETIVQLEAALARGSRAFSLYLWCELCKDDDPNAVRVLELAASAGCRDKYLEVAVIWNRLESDFDATMDVIERRWLSQAWTPPLWFLRPLSESCRTQFNHRLQSAMRRRGYFDVPLRTPYEWLKAANGDLSDVSLHDNGSWLQLAVLLGPKVDNIDHNLSDVRRLIVGPFGLADSLFLCGHLEDQGFDISGFPVDLASVSRLLLGDCSCRDTHGKGYEGPQPGELSSKLALLVLEAYVQPAYVPDLNSVERLLWALSVLLLNPQVDAIEPLVRLERQLSISAEGVERIIDSTLLTRVVNAQPWEDLTEIVRRENVPAAWKAEVLIRTAGLAASPYARKFVGFDDQTIIACFMEGLAIALGNGVTERRLLEGLWFPEVKGESLRSLVDCTLVALEGHDLWTRFLVLRQLAEELLGAGLALDYFDALAADYRSCWETASLRASNAPPW